MTFVMIRETAKADQSRLFTVTESRKESTASVGASVPAKNEMGVLVCECCTEVYRVRRGHHADLAIKPAYS